MIQKPLNISINPKTEQKCYCLCQPKYREFGLKDGDEMAEWLVSLNEILMIASSRPIVAQGLSNLSSSEI